MYMPPELDHLSYSSISSYLACGANWKFKYVDHIPTRPSAALVFGSAFHNTCEGFILGGYQGDITAMWRENWLAQLEKEKISDFDGESPEKFQNDGIRMFNNPEVKAGILSIKAATHADGEPWIEKKVELRVPGVPLPIIGYQDIMTPDGPGDFKTSSRAWSVDQAAKEMQPIFYMAALNQMGVRVDSFTHYVFVKTKTPQFQKITTPHKQSEMFWLFKMIQAAWKGIETGVYPLNPTGWKCDPLYCDFYNICRGKYL
jgi:putative RecB family exonuclease